MRSPRTIALAIVAGGIAVLLALVVLWPAPPLDSPTVEAPEPVALKNVTPALAAAPLPQAPARENSGAISGRVLVRNAEFWRRLARQYESYNGDDKPYGAAGPLRPDSGLPAEGMLVRLDSESLTREVAADEDGRYVFEGIPGGAYIVSVGYVPAAPNGFREARDVTVGGTEVSVADIVLDEAPVAVYGRVEDVSGRPVAEADIFVSDVAHHPAMSELWEQFAPPKLFDEPLTTDGQGSFVVPALRPFLMAESLGASYFSEPEYPGVYVIRAEKKGYVPREVRIYPMTELQYHAAQALVGAARRHEDTHNKSRYRAVFRHSVPIPPEGDAVRGVTIVLPREAIVEGRLVGTNRRPQPNRLLHFARSDLKYRRPNDDKMRTEDGFYETTADGDGRFRIEGVLPGDYAFHIPEGGIALEGKCEPVHVNEGDHITALMVMVQTPEALGAIEGTVIARGQRHPTDGAEVRVERVVSDSPFDIRASLYVSTKRDGRYRFENLPEGRVFLSFVAEAEDDLASLEQRLIERGGKSMAEAREEIAWVKKNREERGIGFDRSHVAVVDATVRAGETTELDVTLEPAAQVIVYVTVHGEPGEHARAYGTWLGPGELSRIKSDNLPGRNDAAFVDGLPEGRCLITATGRDTRQGHVEVTTKYGQTTEVTIDVGGSAEIQVFPPREDPEARISRCYLIALPLSDGRLSPDSDAPAPRETIMAGGQYSLNPGMPHTFPPVPAGTYTVAVKLIGQESTWRFKSVSAGDGARVDVVLDGD